ncbi:bifunctional 3,4-dihydroxy-2-butanone-4-phosphate synthase/GTP cyclohydrolase II [Marinomonas sp. PE14-40]|uniref:bifunctional 3,4-dihydroxy-2-butanone-4-phosphate synthase/GTP cyclohydrolase II n=1 Tax=Marinomonas sp. PE14-40 TaxID=3060621 RepID=UPI003F6720A7
MALNSIEEIISDIRAGKMVILMDDEDRENEGDIIVAAEKVTPEIINFMASKARGLICLTLTPERCDYLGLPSMVAGNGSKFSTPFTVSIEAAEGVTTGISAADRAKTVLAAVNPMGKPDDIVQPGHIFPLRAQAAGVLLRAGHTEAGCDLAALAGLQPSSCIVEIMNEDGTMARRPELEVFAKEHDLKIGTIADLIKYRMANEHTIEKLSQDAFSTAYGEFDLHLYKDTINNDTHMALTKGDLAASEAPLVRVQSQETLRDLLGVNNPESNSWPMSEALKTIADSNAGALVLLNVGEKEDVVDSVETFLGRQKPQPNSNLDSSGSYVTIGTGSQILRDLGVSKMKLLSNPMKFTGISGFELEVVDYLTYQN